MAGLHEQVGREHGQQVGVPFALAGECVGERVADRAFFVADQEVDVGDFVSFASQCFSDKHAHVRCSLSDLSAAWESVGFEAVAGISCQSTGRWGRAGIRPLQQKVEVKAKNITQQGHCKGAAGHGCEFV